MNGGKLFKDLTNAVSSFKNKDYFNFGKDIGDIIYRTLLA